MTKDCRPKLSTAWLVIIVASAPESKTARSTIGACSRHSLAGTGSDALGSDLSAALMRACVAFIIVFCKALVEDVR